MIESLGGRSLEEATCYYIGRCFDSVKPGFSMKRPEELDFFLDRELDVARSLWDRQWLVADLDIEYVNLEFPAEPFLDYERCFSLQEPVVHAIEGILAQAGIASLHTVTGRGHHFMWKIHPASPAFASLARIGRVPAALAGMYARPQPPEGVAVDRLHGQAFAGLALVIEHVSHRILAQAQPRCPIPIVPEAVDMGPQERGSEIIVLDISEYGDPLHTRAVRMPFSLYLKPWLHGDIITPATEGKIPVMVMVPAGERSTDQVLALMRNPARAAEWAAQVSCLLPEGSPGTEHLISQYLDSELRRFHEEFYAVEPEPPERWPFTYDRMPWDGLPPGARYALARPNDVLLKPDFIRQLMIALLDRGWHPRHIAGLIRSKYERDYGWLNLWYIYDAQTRAEFHIRVLGGMVALGRDPVGSVKAMFDG